LQKTTAVLIYSFFVILLLFLALRYVKGFQLPELVKWALPVAFILKICIGLLFNFIHETTYGHGDLSHDGGTFLKEAKYLNDVFFVSPKAYFQLLTGIGESKELVNHYLTKTAYWSAGELTLINDSKNVIRVHSLIHFISGGQMLIHLALMCLLTLFAIKNLYLAFKPYIAFKPQTFFWFLVFVPSTIFWTSTILKEPLLFFGFSLLLRCLLHEEILWKKTIGLTLSMFLLIGFKPYVLVIILLSLITYSFYRYLFKTKLLFTSIFLISITFILGYMFDLPRESMVHYLSRKQFDFVNVGKGGLHAYADTCFYYFETSQLSNLQINKPDIVLLKETDAYRFQLGSMKTPVPVHLIPNGDIWKVYYFRPGCMSYIETTPINNSSIQLIKNIPEAIINSTFRPWPNDPGSNLKLIAFAESTFLFLFLAYAFWKRRILSESEKSIIFGLATFAILLFLLIGWTTPVLGAIARYRFPAQLALFIIGFILLKPFSLKLWKNLYL